MVRRRFGYWAVDTTAANIAALAVMPAHIAAANHHGGRLVFLAITFSFTEARWSG